AVEPGQQLARGGAAVLVEHGVGNVVEVVGRGVPEDQRLDDRRDEKREAAARVLEDSEQFLACQSQDAEDRVEHGAPRTYNQSSESCRTGRPVLRRGGEPSPPPPRGRPAASPPPGEGGGGGGAGGEGAGTFLMLPSPSPRPSPPLALWQLAASSHATAG